MCNIIPVSSCEYFSFHWLCVCGENTYLSLNLKSAQELSIQLYQATGIAIMCLACLFIYCFYGQLLTDESLKINGAAYGMNWYQYPLKYRICVRMIIQYTQAPFYVSIYRLINCSLENFTSVSRFFSWKIYLLGSKIMIIYYIIIFQQIMKTSFTFYMFLRHLDLNWLLST